MFDFYVKTDSIVTAMQNTVGNVKQVLTFAGEEYSEHIQEVLQFSDWVVKDSNGDAYVYSNDEFHKTFRLHEKAWDTNKKPPKRKGAPEPNCPYNYTFGQDFDGYDACAMCRVRTQCEQAEEELRGKA